MSDYLIVVSLEILLDQLSKFFERQSVEHMFFAQPASSCLIDTIVQVFELMGMMGIFN